MKINWHYMTLFLLGFQPTIWAQQRMICHVTRPAGDFSTTVLVENPNGEAGSITFIPYGVDGAEYDPVTLELVPNGVTKRAAETLFDQVGPVSHFTIDQAGEGVTVSVNYLAASGTGSPVHLAESSEQSTNWTFYAGDWDKVYDALALVNTGDEPTRVSLHQIHFDGRRISGEILTEALPPNSKLLNIVGGPIQSQFLPRPDCFFELRADQPLAVISLRGTLEAPHLLWQNPTRPGPLFEESEPLQLQQILPEDAGFSSVLLDEVRPRIEQTQASAVMLLYDGKVLFSWGEVDRNFQLHSIRKPMLNALYGFYAERGLIDLDATLEQLGIDDIPPSLTSDEKQARVTHLLKSRSGVYHEAAGESQDMIDARPSRGSHAPDTHFYYNNWDFNALGTIFRQQTQTDIFEEFKVRIADRIGMQDFQPENCFYQFEPNKSEHPVYKFRMSARDLARFGQLFLNQGTLGGERILSRTWVEESARLRSVDTDSFAGYGYLWAVLPTGYTFGRSMYHTGYGGHALIVMPEQKLVFVYRTNTDVALDLSGSMFEVFTALLGARQEPGCDYTAFQWEGVDPVADTQKFGELLERMRVDMKIPGMSAGIVENGELTWSIGNGMGEVGHGIAVTPETCYQLASLTKPIGAAVIMKLVETGLLDLDTPVSTFGLALDNAENITVRHLLTHTSEGEPGSHFNYNGDLYGLLGDVMESVSGKSFVQLVSEQISEPLNLNHTAPGFSEPAGALPLAQGYCLSGEMTMGHVPLINPAAGLVSNIPDYAQFITALNKGLLLSLESMEEMFTPMVSNTGEDLPHGLGWFVQWIDGTKVIWHAGTSDGTSSQFVMVPEKDLAFIITANTRALNWNLPLDSGDITVSPIVRLFLASFAGISVEGKQ
ncbi:MAG: serine hydrolase [Acidobacteriota bacterium]|nr:serine hydrolase [Acidobacteriota bacterium]